MKLFTHTSTLTETISKLKTDGLQIGFVPTMGALHKGHLSLVKKANDECDITIVSIFVNPTQFNNKQDLATYPTNLDKDKVMLKESESDILFAPSVSEIYPNGEVTNTYNLNGLDLVYEGAKRPGHFDGVCTVVHRLLSITQADRAYFGQKDFQQLAIIRQMVNETTLQTKIIEGPTIRESSGLAMSSRNQLLSAHDRKYATIIYKLLTEAKQSYGKRPISDILTTITKTINSQKNMIIDYVDIVNPRNLKPIKSSTHIVEAHILIAVFIGEVRLIDNLALNY